MARQIPGWPPSLSRALAKTGEDHQVEPHPAAYATRVDVPVLLLYGEQDPWILPGEREVLKGALRGPAEMVSFPGQGHGSSYVYGDPERWDAAVRSFLDRL